MYKLLKDFRIRKEIEGILELDEAEEIAVRNALGYVVEHPEEFSSPGIGLYAQSYQALSSLFRELAERLTPDTLLTITYRDVAHSIRKMSRHIAEGLECYAFFPVEADEVLKDMAFLERYFTKRTILKSEKK